MCRFEHGFDPTAHLGGTVCRPGTDRVAGQRALRLMPSPRKTDIESRTSDAASVGGSLRDLTFRRGPWSAGQSGTFPLLDVRTLVDARDTAGSACPSQGPGNPSVFRRAALCYRAEH